MPAPTEIMIVATTPDMIESFRRTLDVVARERRFLALLEAPPLPQTRAFVLNCLAKGDPHVVALAHGEVVGWCDIRRHDFATHAHRGLLGIGVLPAWRGRGIGLALIQAALSRARAAGLVRVELDVHADNQRAITLYEKVGFVREGLLRDAVLVDGAYRDAVVMAIVDRASAIPSGSATI